MQYKSIHVVLGMFLFLSVIFCSKYPEGPDYKGIGDCSKPTIPPGLNFNDSLLFKKNGVDSIVIPVSQKIISYGFTEIFDYEKNLVQSGLFGPFITSYTWRDTGNFIPNTYWNGIDSKGNKVDNGRYIIKMTYISTLDTACGCADVVITTN